MAETIAAGTGSTPHSPTPLTPKGFNGDGDSWCRIVTIGRSGADGSRYSPKLAVTGCAASSKPIHSKSAFPTPCATPPRIWPSTIMGLILQPQSCAMTSRSMVTSPVSGSTSTAATAVPLA